MDARKKNRALIFQPFDAFKGLHNLIEERERKRELKPRKILSEDECEVLNRQIYQIQKGMDIEVVYYEFPNQLSVEGKVSSIDLKRSKSIGINGVEVRIRDILEIHGVGDGFSQIP